MTKEEREAVLSAINVYGSAAADLQWSALPESPWGYVVTEIAPTDILATWTEFGDIAHLAAQFTASE